MIHIYICEDSIQQLEAIQKIIYNQILIMEYDMRIEYTTTDPYKLMEYTDKTKTKNNLFFLDIDLNCDINGLALAQNIKNMDSYAKIIFITGHAEMSYMTFLYKVEALDYILKNNMEVLKSKVVECLEVVHKRQFSTQQKDDVIFVSIGERKIHIDIHDILYIESSYTPHKLILHLKNRELEFYGGIKEFESYHENLMRCHQSYVVNIKNIKELSGKEIIMGNDVILHASTRFIKIIKQRLSEYKYK